jgi:AbiV family abortive infection protein
MQKITRRSLEYRGPLSPAQAAEGIRVINRNVRELHRASQILFTNGCYAQSTALSMIAMEESQKVPLVLMLVYAVSAEDQRAVWAEFRDHKKKHAQFGHTLASNAVVEGKLPLEATAIVGFAANVVDPSAMELGKQLLIYSDCLAGPRWSLPANIAGEQIARQHLMAVAEMVAGLYDLSEDELKIWAKHMIGAHTSASEMLDRFERTQQELAAKGLPDAKLLQKLIDNLRAATPNELA